MSTSFKSNRISLAHTLCLWLKKKDFCAWSLFDFLYSQSCPAWLGIPSDMPVCCVSASSCRRVAASGTRAGGKGNGFPRRPFLSHPLSLTQSGRKFTELVEVLTFISVWIDLTKLFGGTSQGRQLGVWGSLGAPEHSWLLLAILMCRVTQLCAVQWEECWHGIVFFFLLPSNSKYLSTYLSCTILNLLILNIYLLNTFMMLWEFEIAAKEKFWEPLSFFNFYFENMECYVSSLCRDHVNLLCIIPILVSKHLPFLLSTEKPDRSAVFQMRKAVSTY